ncbi:MAG TPA: M48 family metalloprotease [Patescibacteria group bacterium]|nr:M48 family metalloprotease [Patescibacteria group bacterium]
MAGTIYNQISSNKTKTWIIMVLFVLFFFTVSYVLGVAFGYGRSWAIVMLFISAAFSFISYYNSDKIVLSINGAKPADKEHYRALYTAVENLSIATGLPMPKVYVVEDPSPNAFATGRDPKHAAVAATTGLLERLKPAELEGVIAHEMSHVKNYDTRLMGVVAILVGSIAMLANIFMRSMWFRDDEDRNSNQIFMILGIVAAILAPLIATLIQLAVSRRREYLADANGALITRYPDGLADALEKIADYPRPLKHANTGTAHLYIENPYKADTGKTKGNWLVNLFSTHPPIEERIKILRDM